METGKLAGTLTLVARRGEVIHTGVTGLMDRERNKPMREDTIFRIYSMTKPITSVAFMMLVEEGLVALDEPVHRYIPEWRDLGVFVAGVPGGFRPSAPSRPMLIVDLLRHTSGLTYGFQTRTNVDAAYRKLSIGTIEKSPVSLDGMIAALAKMPAGIFAGRGVELFGLHRCARLSGRKDFRHAIREISAQRIFEPLSMVDTGFPCAAGKSRALCRLLQFRCERERMSCCRTIPRKARI